MFENYLDEGVKRGPSLTSLSQILQSSFKAIYCDQAKIQSSELGAMYVF